MLVRRLVSLVPLVSLGALVVGGCVTVAGCSADTEGDEDAVQGDGANGENEIVSERQMSGSELPDHTLSLKQGAVYPWAKTGSTSPYYEQTLEALARHFKVAMTTPWEKLLSSTPRSEVER